MATVKDKTVPNLENATPSFLIDEIGKIRIEASRLKFLEGVYKQALEARIGEDQLKGNALIEGTFYLGSRTKKTQERIDTELVRAYFAHQPEELSKLIKVIEFWQLDCKPKVTDV